MNNQHDVTQKYKYGSKLLTFFNAVLCATCYTTLFCKMLALLFPNAETVRLFVDLLYSFCLGVEPFYLPGLFGIVLIFWISKLISKNITKKMLIINLSMTFLSVVYMVVRLLWWRYAVFSQPLHP